MAAANDAYYISYTFTAVAGQDLVITATQNNLNYSWHLYGISNEEAPAFVDVSIANTAATNITVATADLGGMLNATGSVFDVTVYWSTNDNADAAAWLADGTASSALVGTYTNVTGLPVTRSVSSLTVGTTYYYTMRVSNPETNVWAAANASFTTASTPADCCSDYR